MTKAQLIQTIQRWIQRFKSASPQQQQGVLTLAILIVVFITLGLMKLTSNKPGMLPKTTTSTPISATQIEVSALSPTVELIGKTTSPQTTTLSSPVTAYVTSVNALEGELHGTNKVLIQLSQQDAQLTVLARNAEVKEIKAQISAEHTKHLSNQRLLKTETALLKIAKRSVERFNNLTSKQVAAEQQRDDALKNQYQQALKVEQIQLEIDSFEARISQLESALTRAEANANQAQLDNDRLTLVAPFDSRIIEVNVSPGNRLNPGDSVIKLYNVGSLEVEAQVPDRWLNHIRQILDSKNSPIRASALIDSTKLSLTLSRLAGSASKQAGGVMAIFSIECPPKWLEIERSVKIQVVLPAIEQVIAVPESALHDRNRIYKIVDETLVGLTVTRVGTYVSAEGHRQAIIQSDDLQTSDFIMSTNLPNAMSGIQVNVQ